MIDFKNENSFIYRIGVPAIQIIVLILLLLGGAFNNKIEWLGDILRLACIIIQMFLCLIFGTKELLVKKNKLLAYFCYGVVFATIIFILYLNIIF